MGGQHIHLRKKGVAVVKLKQSKPDRPPVGIFSHPQIPLQSGVVQRLLRQYGVQKGGGYGTIGKKPGAFALYRGKGPHMFRAGRHNGVFIHRGVLSKASMRICAKPQSGGTAYARTHSHLRFDVDTFQKNPGVQRPSGNELFVTFGNSLHKMKRGRLFAMFLVGVEKRAGYNRSRCTVFFPDAAAKGIFPKKGAAMASLLDRFLRYITVDTRSDEESGAVPSTSGQMDLARMLAGELEQLGLRDITLTENAYLTAHLPARNVPETAPRIGLIAHLDTATEYSGANVRAKIIENYDGGAVNLGSSLRLEPTAFPVLREKIGKTLITTDGSTLLGGDDKAGIAIIMTALAELKANPGLPRPALVVAFTPDEEIGHGAALLDIGAFGADFAYTVDGGGLATIEYENFNAALATLSIRGLAIHPGDAKDRMVNAILLGQAFLDGLPADERPENTEGRQGFYHVDSFTGEVAKAEISLLVRDHDRERFEARKAFLTRLTEELNLRWPAGPGEEPRFTLELRDQYRNMLEQLRPHMHIVDTAKAVMRSLGLEPEANPIRGGTDGAQLSWRGLPCPNLFDGGYNMHGPFEFVVLEEMRAAVDVILGIVAAYAHPHPEGKV